MVVPSLAKSLLKIALGCALCLSLPNCEGRAQAAGLSAKDTAKAKEARQLYKAGKYDAAAEIFLRLSNDYPDMLVLTRNLGGTPHQGWGRPATHWRRERRGGKSLACPVHRC